MLEAFHSSPSAGLWSSLVSSINSLARQSSLVQRASARFSPEKFLLSPLDAVTTGRASINQLVGTGDGHRTTSPKHLKALVLAGMISMSISLVVDIRLARGRPRGRYSMEKIFDYVIARFAGLKRLAGMARLHPDPRIFQSQKRSRNSLCQRLMKLLS